jgi:hypothetical protein
MKNNHIVFTTIYVPEVLHALYANISHYNHLDETVVWVVGDRKTPMETVALCERISDQGLEVNYLNISDQDQWGKQFPEFYRRIPYDNETRRNIGYLHALAHGCRRLISVDDDNWPTMDDFIAGHSLTGTSYSGSLLSEASGFHNICEYLEFDVQRPIYPRGFPFKLRGSRNSGNITQEADPAARIGVTAGLWLMEPDVDATTWLNGRISGVSYSGQPCQVLSPDTWTPINTQNTSVIRELIPAYFCIPMGWDVPGGKIQRYGDIWGGYFIQALLKGLPYRVAFGRPLVEHRRNPHDYLDDLRQEYWGMILTDWLLDLLQSRFNPTESDICDRIDHLAEFIRSDLIPSLPSWCSPEISGFMLNTAENVTAWNAACRELR